MLKSKTMFVVMLLKSYKLDWSLYCGIDKPFTSEDHYPQSETCSSHESVKCANIGIRYTTDSLDTYHYFNLLQCESLVLTYSLSTSY